MVGRHFILSADNSQGPVLLAVMSKFRSISQLSLISSLLHLDSMLETDDNKSAPHRNYMRDIPSFFISSLYGI
jgi:hypothetical protein